MAFGERVSRGWMLTQQSFRVLMLDKELLVFPVVSAVAAIAVMATFVAPLWTSGTLQALGETGEAPRSPLLYVWLFAFYFANYFVMVYFNAAIVGCAIKRLRGGDPTVADGFRVATKRLPQIAAWALLSATVGLVLRMIEERVEGLGRLVTGLIGAAWSVATYFVVPVLVVEGVGPFEALKRSAGVLRKSWGEALVSRLGMGLVVMVAALAALLPAAIGFATGTTTGAVIGVAITAGLLILVSAGSAALNAILVAALYEFAADGKVPNGFDEAALRGAFGPKRRRGSI